MNNKILIVEDELLIALDMQGTLEKLGFEVIIDVTSVEQAILYIEEHQPMLVLIDINLNKNKDGTHLGQYLLQKDTMPYIYITSYADKSTLDQVNATRPNGYIVKPFKDDDLKATVSVVLNNYYHKKIDALRNNENENDPVPLRIRKVVDYINNHLDKKIEIHELATLTEWKMDHFIRLFSKYLKTTPYQYILSRKINKAKSLLEDTVVPINEIVFELGFESNSNFYQAFKKITNDTPENYRRKQQLKSTN
ncbi:AraC-like DNA-binding protein [Flavobacterium limicola]|uniref:AraC-like DNA-binding protein n=1 Tax=Flavobacterium limicola TaxID=180441 RepID=A0A495S8W3_9FLAO|nr:response regulator transcription factor [Flavobacterium limicola]RKS95528.1 AraC-like DNA-binding protein [Flavobacterium limicola]